MSAITDIVVAVAAIPARYDGVVVPVRVYETTPIAVAEADLPMRIIVATASEVRDYRFWTPAGAAQAQIVVDDLLLVQSVGLGDGIDAIARPLNDYIDDYVRRARFLRFARATLASISARAGVIEYPEGAGVTYHGARVTIVVRYLVEQEG
jgi:hypothetical protein